MHLGRCHSCASQRHPDTMHNITPPHKGAAALRRTKNGKESQQKKLNPETMKELAPHQPRHQLSQWLRPQCTTYRTIHAGSARRTRLPPARRPPTSTGPSAANSPVASYSSEPPSTLLPVSSGPASALILDSDAAQVIFQDQRSISEMRFRLPASLSDGISLPHHQIQAPGSFALMPENRLHFILLLTIDHNGRRRSLLPFELFGPLEPFQVRYMEDRMDPPGWGKIQSVRHWRNHPGDSVRSNPAPP